MGVSRHTGEYKTTERKRAYSKELRLINRSKVINYYSNGTNKCAICGEHRLEFLTTDHIEANPHDFAEKLGYSRSTVGGNALTQMLVSTNYPNGIQILCYNCNMLKRSHITSKGKLLYDRSQFNCNKTKQCLVCKQVKNICDFNRDGKRWHSYCGTCHALKASERHNSTKLELITLLGGKCSCCDESRIQYLSIEHSNNDGSKHSIDIINRYSLKLDTKLGNARYRYILKDIKNGIMWPGMIVHCFNCNCSKGANGYCPHEIERGELILDSNGDPIRKEIHV